MTLDGLPELVRVDLKTRLWVSEKTVSRCYLTGLHGILLWINFDRAMLLAPSQRMHERYGRLLWGTKMDFNMCFK